MIRSRNCASRSSRLKTRTFASLGSSAGMNVCAPRRLLSAAASTNAARARSASLSVSTFGTTAMPWVRIASRCAGNAVFIHVVPKSLLGDRSYQRPLFALNVAESRRLTPWSRRCSAARPKWSLWISCSTPVDAVARRSCSKEIPASARPPFGDRESVVRPTHVLRADLSYRADGSQVVVHGPERSARAARIRGLRCAAGSATSRVGCCALARRSRRCCAQSTRDRHRRRFVAVAARCLRAGAACDRRPAMARHAVGSALALVVPRLHIVLKCRGRMAR